MWPTMLRRPRRFSTFSSDRLRSDRRKSTPQLQSGSQLRELTFSTRSLQATIAQADYEREDGHIGQRRPRPPL